MSKKLLSATVHNNAIHSHLMMRTMCHIGLHKVIHARAIILNLHRVHIAVLTMCNACKPKYLLMFSLFVCGIKSKLLTLYGALILLTVLKGMMWSVFVKLDAMMWTWTMWKRVWKKIGYDNVFKNRCKKIVALRGVSIIWTLIRITHEALSIVVLCRNLSIVLSVKFLLQTQGMARNNILMNWMTFY